MIVFVFDTNILSAMMSVRPVPEVREWMAGQDRDLFSTTAMSQAEILAGLAIMPAGRRRHDLQAVATAMFAEEFEGRVLPFDTNAAASYADIIVLRRTADSADRSDDRLNRAITRCQRRDAGHRRVRRMRPDGD